MLCSTPNPSLLYHRETRRVTGPPAGTLPLAHARVSTTHSQPTAFTVEAVGRVYHLRAASAGQRQLWVDAITAAVSRATAAADAAAAAAAASTPSPPHVANGRRRTTLADGAPSSAPAARRFSSSSAGADTALPSPGSRGSTPGSEQPGSRWPPFGRPWAPHPFSLEGGHDPTQQQAAGGAAVSGARATDGAAAYSAGLPSLQGRQPIQALMAGVSGLPLESIAEHYQRALLFLERHRAELGDEQLAVLEVSAAGRQRQGQGGDVDGSGFGCGLGPTQAS